MTFALIQARQSSSRFNNKIFQDLKGNYVIDWVIDRISLSNKIKKIYILIPNNKKNLRLKKYLKDRKINFFVGSENDVLERFYLCAKKFTINEFVRICADNPIICPNEIDKLIEFYQKNKCDYAYNHIPINNNYPNGLGAEMSNFRVLELLHKKAKKREHREHIFNYLWDNKDTFSIKTFNHYNSKLNFPNIRLDINYKKDLQKLNKLNISIYEKSEKIVSKYIINFNNEY